MDAKPISRPAMGVLGALGAVMLVAAACGGGSSTKTPTAAATTAAKSPTAAVTSSVTQSSGTTTAGGATLKVATDPALGQFLTDGAGLTLYIFKNDVANNGKSAAEGLAAAWPPLTADAPPAKPSGAAGDFAIVTRDDGKKQVTYKGLPLYYYAQDKAPGDTKGQAVANIWFVAAP